MSAHHWGKAFAKRWVLCCVPNVVGLGFIPFLAIRSHTQRCFTSFPYGLSNNRVGLRGGGEECFVWVFF